MIHNYNGLLVPQADVEATVEAIEYLMQNPQIAKEMGKNGIIFSNPLSQIKACSSLYKP